MPIPDFQTVMLPLLKMAADGQQHHIQDATNVLADQFGLTEGELKELLPSGVDRVFRNRIGWARTYLKKAGLIEYPKRGCFRATERGQTVIAQKPSRINISFLMQYPEFVEFHTAKFCETALNLFPGNSPSIMWFSQLAPAIYRGTDLMPFAPWHGIENQTASTDTT